MNPDRIAPSSSREERFASLYEAHHPKVTAYFRRRAHADQVDDLVATVFLHVWRRIEDAPEGDGLPWIYRISHLILRNHWRGMGRKQRLNSRLEAAGISPRVSLQEQVVMRDELREVMEAASRLRPEDQELLRLSMWEHLSSEDIGEVLGIKPNAVKQRLHRARKALVREHKRLASRPQHSPAAQKGGEW